MPTTNDLDRAGAIARYIEIADRLPTAKSPSKSVYVDNLSDLVDEFDAFVLDGFGVLNVGTEVIPGAVERVTSLQQQGKRMLVLTNGATVPVEQTVKKYEQWGFQFQPTDVVSSRNALEHALREQPQDMLWGVAATDFACIDQLAPRTVLLEDNPADYAAADGFIFLSAMDWSDQRQKLLHDALQQNRRPVLVGNPDLVAPRETDMSLEPGYFSHALADAAVCSPEFYGKPFKLAFELVAERLNGVAPHRIAMVGDTLHTDILGGAHFGWRTVLIEGYGLMKGSDVEQTCRLAGIQPDFVCNIT